MELSPIKVQELVSFAAPGIIILYLRSRYLTGQMPSLQEGIVAFLTISIVYHAVLVATGPWSNNYQVNWILQAGIGPAAIGIALGINIRKG